MVYDVVSRVQLKPLFLVWMSSYILGMMIALCTWVAYQKRDSEPIIARYKRPITMAPNKMASTTADLHIYNTIRDCVITLSAHMIIIVPRDKLVTHFTCAPVEQVKHKLS